jgi:oligopeptide transport system permease protein
MPDDQFVPAMAAPSTRRDNPLTRSLAGLIGLATLAIIILTCFASIPWTFASPPNPDGSPGMVRQYEAGQPNHARFPPAWWPTDTTTQRRIIELAPPETREDAARRVASNLSITPQAALTSSDPEVISELARTLKDYKPVFALGSDALGRSLLVRLLVGGTISIGVGIAAALISVFIGTLYGATAGYIGGRLDAFMMRIVDILYGLPYILLVVLIAVAADGAIDRWQRTAIQNASAERQAWVEQQVSQAQDPESDRPEIEAAAATMFTTGELSGGQRAAIDVLALLIAIGGVSWLTMARVVRGQVLSLKAQPFVESARAIGAPAPWIFTRHLLPNLLGPIIVYATLTVPQAILQESFLSFLGIGIKPPLPSWGNLAADGLSELNRHRSHWWLLFFPCLMLGITLLSLNFVGEGLREAFDPKRARK